MTTACLFPGQGSQHEGMGVELFARHPELVAQADEILGWSLVATCRDDPAGRLRDTEVAQPAIFAVDALSWLEWRARHDAPAFVAGHSLGEYAALFAAGCIDFATGVRLVQRRGALMARAAGGGMAAVVGVEPDELVRLLADAGCDVDVANHNSADQVVLSGADGPLDAALELVTARDLGRVMPLPVSGAFHSRLMTDAAREFEKVLAEVDFAPPATPVIANVTARPYEADGIVRLLADQIDSSVRWSESMAYLVDHGVTETVELGPGTVLTSLWRSAQRTTSVATRPAGAAHDDGATRRDGLAITAGSLGSSGFRHDYGVRTAYVAGSMYHGIASTDLVAAMGRAGLLGFFGSGGLPVDDVDAALTTIQRALGADGTYGVNLLCTLDNPTLENELVDLYLRRGVRFVEAAAYPHVTPPLVRWRFTGARDGVAPHRILAKVSRPEVATAFLDPPPDKILAALVAAGGLTEDEAAIARTLPMSQEICVESDSAGHTDQGIALALLPALIQLRDELVSRHGYDVPVRVGAAGGLGSPEALAAVFVLGADFVLTGSINQCTPQAGTSDEVKDLLATLDVQDTTYAPAGDVFELGAQVQVARKGTLFPVRAQRLVQAYRQAARWEDVEPRLRASIEKDCFGRPFAEVWAETREYLRQRHPDELERADADPRRRMAWAFRSYFHHSTAIALDGDEDERVDFQVHCGPAMGTFNRWVAGTDLEDWHARDVAVVADRLMTATADLLATRLGELTGSASSSAQH
ncbi:trans-AT polyketide synthase, acyltransferase and oxidoreductase domain-containing protein [Jatrophihabitans endophyticus]|uniref:[acyl-carrier-protein] S-malonyltransferase n=1 Tax=Jatrophihabitans endophyticus TaxID=1206085 RepID=A0A1M5I4K9_9ACTN|nr:ACP S-malonyltransferase [Jatrophihabitans endophyticus]SHG23202.1 trans-AT polyketide synthase, acyltransferase and oxidoreductase domain-containing protein [Jatrophihabitans endophyticus]